MSIKVSVENLSNIEKKLTISIPKEEIDTKVQQRLREIAPKVRIAGFRKGKVPMNMIEKNYQGTVRGEVLEKEIEKSYTTALEQENIAPVGMPRIELAASPEAVPEEGSAASAAGEQSQEVTATASTDVAVAPSPVELATEENYFTYYAFVETFPEIAVANLTDIAVDRYETAVTEEDVSSMLEKMRKRDAEWIEVTDAAEGHTVQQGDKVVVDFTTTVHEDTPDVSAKEEEEKDVKFEIGGGEMWPDFEAPLIGKVVGDKVTFTLRFPETHIKKDVAGKMADFSVQIKQLWKGKIPPLDEKFAKNHDVEEGGIEALRLKLHETMEKNIKRSLEDIFHADMCSKLVALHSDSLAVPKVFVQEEIKREREIMADQYKNILRLKSLPQGFEFPDSLFEKKAQHNVMLSMLLGRIAELHNLRVTPEEMHAEIEKRAATYHTPEDVVSWFNADKKRMKRLESELLTAAVLKFVEQQVQVISKQISYKEALEKKAVDN